MKKQTIICCFLFAFFLGSQLNSQTQIGVRGGVSFATINDDSSVFTDTEKGYLTGYDFAAFAKIGLAEFISLQPEFHYVRKGVKYSSTSQINPEAQYSFVYDYIELPVLARADFGNEDLKVNFFAGPSFGYGLKGKAKYKNILDGSGDPEVLTTTEEDLEWDKEYGTDGIKDNRFDISGVLGIGLEYGIGPVKAVLDGRYVMDFNDHFNYENSTVTKLDKYMNRGFSLTIGVAYPLGN